MSGELPAAAGLARLRLDEPTPAHRATIATLLRRTGVFRDDEIEVALEVLDAYWRQPARDYDVIAAFAEDDDAPLGYACYGRTPCTAGTWDLYWIAVDPVAQGLGVGTRLLREVERRLELAGARLLLIETSSRAEYRPTRRFYERRGYAAVARVPDFYAPGDDRVIFARNLH